MSIENLDFFESNSKRMFDILNCIFKPKTKRIKFGIGSVFKLNFWTKVKGKQREKNK